MLNTNFTQDGIIELKAKDFTASSETLILVKDDSEQNDNLCSHDPLTIHGFADVLFLTSDLIAECTTIAVVLFFMAVGAYMLKSLL